MTWIEYWEDYRKAFWEYVEKILAEQEVKLKDSKLEQTPQLSPTNNLDEWIVCADCGELFPFTFDMQVYYSEHSLHRPKRCKQCRAVRRMQVLTDDEIDEILFLDEEQPFRYV